MLDSLAYEPPRLTQLPFLAFTKHRSKPVVSAASRALEIDVGKLVKEYGSPVFVVSEEQLRNDFRNFLSAFSDKEIDTRIAYSVKTNYLPAICAILRQEGAWAEVVSGMEYDLMRSLNVPGSDIIFNGPHKTQPEVQVAVADGAIINVDNFAELDMVAAIARAMNRTARIGLRFSFQYGYQAWTKFGFNDDNGDMQRALERVACTPELDLVLLHNHCGTFVLMHDLYAQSADRMIGIARRARKLGLTPTMADFGGGFPSRNILKPEFDVPGGSRRAGNFWLPYGDLLCRALANAKDLFGGRPTLVLEPGRALVDECVSLATTVVARKRIPGQGDAIIVDAGVNLVPTACYYEHEVVAAHSGNEPASIGRRNDRVSVYGPLCMQSDVIRHQAPLPGIEVGDHLVIRHVGAYCHTQSSQFIQTRPATVLVGPHGAEIIRRQETWRDVFALDRLPDRLRPDGSTF